MTTTRAEVEGLVLRIQGEFLNSPELRLTLGDVARRVGITATACEAVLKALVEAGVVTMTANGDYERLFPLRARRTGTVRAA